MSGRPKRVRKALKNRWTNQTGLMQAGSAPRIGRQGPTLTLLGRRVNSRLQTCGQGYKGLRCLYELDANNISDDAAKKYCKRVVNYDPLTVCNPRQPKNRQNAGGVGNIYTARRDNCNQKCGEEQCWVIKEDFSSGNLVNSQIFIPFNNSSTDHHNVEIVRSSELWPGPNPSSPFYNTSTNGSVPGFNSMQAPFSTPYYARYGNTGETDEKGEKQGRFLKSKNFNFKDLISITISYIAGGIDGDKLNSTQKKILQDNLTTYQSNTNPFTLAFQNPAFQSFSPTNNKIPSLLNGGDIPDVHAASGYPREPEDLFIQFYDNYNQPVGDYLSLFTPKTRPAIAGKGDLFIYGSSKFSIKTFYIKNKNIARASYFKIQQRRHTNILDNYGIKYVQCNFCNDRHMPLSFLPPDISYPLFVKKPPQTLIMSNNFSQPLLKVIPAELQLSMYNNSSAVTRVQDVDHSYYLRLNPGNSNTTHAETIRTWPNYNNFRSGDIIEVKFDYRWESSHPTQDVAVPPVPFIADGKKSPKGHSYPQVLILQDLPNTDNDKLLARRSILNNPSNWTSETLVYTIPNPAPANIYIRFITRLQKFKNKNGHTAKSAFAIKNVEIHQYTENFGHNTTIF